MNAHAQRLVLALSHLLDPEDPLPRAHRLVQSLGGVHRLRLAPLDSIPIFDVLSPREVVRIAAAFELVGGAMSLPADEPLTRAEHVVRRMCRLALASVEEVWVISVDAGLRVVGQQCVARGGVASCGISGVEILRRTLLHGGVGFFLVHNHPSGDPTASDQDLEITARVGEQARMMGLTFHDHLVVASGRWSSCLKGDSGSIEWAALPCDL